MNDTPKTPKEIVRARSGAKSAMSTPRTSRPAAHPPAVPAPRQPDGVWYIGVFNTDTSARRTFRVWLAQLGLGSAIRVTDLWTGRSLGVVTGSYSTTIAPGGVSLISARPVPGRSQLRGSVTSVTILCHCP